MGAPLIYSAAESDLEHEEYWAFLSQLGRIFDAFTELDSVTPQSGHSNVGYLFPTCETRMGMTSMNDIVAQLLSSFANSAWMESTGVLRRTYRWDDPILSNFSNRATMAQIRRNAVAAAQMALAA